MVEGWWSLLDGLHWVDVGDARVQRVHIPSAIGVLHWMTMTVWLKLRLELVVVLRVLLLVMGLMVVGWKIHLEVLCLAR